jgi:AcrR family transcriptional regulator
VISSTGIQGVGVEQLARRLRITKGSFYYHFRNRDELHAAMLDDWRARMVTDIIADLERVGDPHERFRQILRLTYNDRRADRDVETAIQSWARADARAAAALQEVDALRVDYIRRVLISCGVPAGRAEARAITVLAFVRMAPQVSEQILSQCEQLWTNAI